MNKSNKKGSNNSWKLILLICEVVWIIFLVWLIFASSWDRRPEKYRNSSAIETSYSRVTIEVHNTNDLPILLSKEQPEKLQYSSFEEIVASYVFDICQSYPEVDPYIVLSVIYHESRFIPNVSAGRCVGLMQISTYWHQDRAKRLGVTDFWDPYSNILIGVDLLNELMNMVNGDIYRALTRYNGGSGISNYAREVINIANEYREGNVYDPWSSTSKNSARAGGSAYLGSV